MISFAIWCPEIHEDLSQISEFHSAIKHWFRITCALKSATTLIYFIDVPFQISLLNYYYFIFYFLFVVNFVIHWNETAMGLHVFPIPIPPPISLSTRSL